MMKAAWRRFAMKMVSPSSQEKLQDLLSSSHEAILHFSLSYLCAAPVFCVMFSFGNLVENKT